MKFPSFNCFIFALCIFISTSCTPKNDETPLEVKNNSQLSKLDPSSSAESIKIQKPKFDYSKVNDLESANAVFVKWLNQPFYKGKMNEMPPFAAGKCSHLSKLKIAGEAASKNTKFKILKFKVGNYNKKPVYFEAEKFIKDPDELIVCEGRSWIHYNNGSKTQTDVSLRCDSSYDWSEVSLCLYTVSHGSKSSLYLTETTNGPACVPYRLLKLDDSGTFKLITEICGD